MKSLRSEAPCSRVLLLLALAGCTSDPREPDDAVAGKQHAVVHGADDRRERYELVDRDLREFVGLRAVALMESSALSRAEGSVGLAAESSAAVHNLCPGVRFSQQPAAALCSGILVDERTVLTAGHCAKYLPCEQLAIVSGYYMESEGRLHPLEPSDVYQCQTVLASELSSREDDERLDYAWILLDRAAPVTELQFRQPDVPLQTAERLTLLGFGEGLPLKVDANTVVTDARLFDLDYFLMSADSFHGGSGAGLFDHSMQLVGIVSRGSADYEATSEGCNIVHVKTDDPLAAEEAGTYAFRALQGLCEAVPSHRLCCDEAGTCTGAQASCNVSGANGNDRRTLTGPMWTCATIALAAMRRLRRWRTHPSLRSSAPS